MRRNRAEWHRSQPPSMMDHCDHGINTGTPSTPCNNDIEEPLMFSMLLISHACDKERREGSLKVQLCRCSEMPLVLHVPHRHMYSVEVKHITLLYQHGKGSSFQRQTLTIYRSAGVQLQWGSHVPG